MDVELGDIDFELEPDTHRYLLNGKDVPSCTRLLELARNPIMGMSWERLAAIERGEIPVGRAPKRLIQQVGRARKRGNAVHKAVELHVKQDLDRRTLTREVGCRLDLWRFFEDDYKVRPVPILELPKWWPDRRFNILCEVPLVHPHFMFGVTEDCGLFEVDGALATIEVKVTSGHNAATALQTACQKETTNYWFENSVGKVEERYGVRLDPQNKRADVKRYTDKADWSSFLSFMNVFHWRQINKIGETYD